LKVFLQELLLDPPTLGMVCSHPGALTKHKNMAGISCRDVWGGVRHFNAVVGMVTRLKRVA